MTAGAGTTVVDPVTVEQIPNLKGSKHEIDEYLLEHRAYDVFDFLLKELMTKQPADPLEHLVKCLECPDPMGPVKAIVSGPPGAGRPALAKRFARELGVAYVGAGELLREAGVDVDHGGYVADDALVSKLVLDKLTALNDKMQGWVLDGFPRTRAQTTFLKEARIVPALVALMQTDEESIRQRNRRVEDGEVAGIWLQPEVLEEKLRVHCCHNQAALDSYTDRMYDVGAKTDDESEILREMLEVASKLPRSKGPAPPMRVVLSGGPGASEAIREHATRLAAALGLIVVHADDLRSSLKASRRKPKAESHAAAEGVGVATGSADVMSSAARSSLDLPHVERLAAEHALGVVGVRLQQSDCKQQGWVLCGFPTTMEEAQALQQDSTLRPLRVVSLKEAAAAAEAPSARILREVYGPRHCCAEILLAEEGSLDDVVSAEIRDFVERPLCRDSMMRS